MIVRQTKPFITYVGSKFFYPGMNTFTEQEAAELLADPSFTSKVKDKLLEIIGKNSAPVINISPSSVKAAVTKISVVGLASSAAIKIIESTFNVAALKDLALTDQRKGIQDAIAKQLKRIDDQKVVVEKKEEE